MPGAENEKMAEDAYQAVRKFISTRMGELSPQRYYKIFYEHNGLEVEAEVGCPDPLEGNLVVAIFRSAEASGPFYVCTPHRGVIDGHPILANGGPHTRAIHFEDYPS